MCGFAGFVNNSALTCNYAEVLKKMGRAIYHRGPDSSGEWFDEKESIGLSHRRLAVVDLTPAGHQPMYSHGKRFVVAYNGEIYNHLELRKELEREASEIKWLGGSDTETLLAGFELWGIKKTVEKSIGMFAFSVWDTLEKKLTLGRDRLGEKPLYYGWQDDVFLFGSELKAMKVHPAFKSEINRDSIALLLRHNCIPAPYSIYRGIKKLLPGHLLEMDPELGTIEMIEYWSFRNLCQNHDSSFFVGGEKQVVDELEKVLKLSVKQQMMSDVPLGAFLSGGIDSSTIVALMQSQSETPVKTFSIGFDEEEYNEAAHAKEVANYLGTEHTELYITSEQALDVIPKLADLYDEPFSDSSQIPTYLVAKMTRDHVTVSLSGDAGDELFCGYNRYILSDGLWKFIEKTPRPIRKIAARAMRAISIESWNKLSSFFPAKLRMVNLGGKMHKASEVLAAESVYELYKGLVSHWHFPEQIVIGAKEPKTVLTDLTRAPRLDNSTEQMMVFDTVSYLPDDILVKVDRACMGVSLESRIPLLNHKVIEFAWSLPMNFKLRDGVSKWCLRQVLFRHVPKNLIERPKMGFGVPIDSWLRGPLQSWADQLLDESRLHKEGFFKPEPILKMWSEHKSGKRNWQYHLWDILMFQSWYEKNC